MSSKPNKESCSRGSSARSKHTARVFAQTSLDAKLHAEFEESGQPFDYSISMGAANLSTSGEGGESSGIPSSSVSAYLQRMQRGQCIQPFGCMVAVDDQTFVVIAYSENAPEMLDLTPHAVPSIEQRDALTIGMDARSLFRSLSFIALQKAASFADVNLLNPILVHCRNSGKPFYAILHRINEGLVIELEPVNPTDVPVTAAGALKSYKLAAKAISRLQSLPSGSISLMCDVLVREVNELTGYDRVMVYKFHEDEHGEVIAECHRPDLEPYLGLHYPATDIPQASRFLFMKNKVRMICDCSAQPVKVIQDHRFAQPMSLCGSTLRAPHGCHAQYMANMGSIASLVLSITINDDDDDDGTRDSDQQPKGRKLWGLVVCHHTSPRFVPFPLRYACEFLLQVFGIQLNKEVELAAQTKEKHILQTQIVICDMILRDSPISIFTQSPNVMDLVKCEGAALYYREQFWLLGTTPTEVQIKDIIAWLQECHDGSTGLSTDSLTEAGYPGADALGDSVCGMAAIKITSSDFIFWFRPHTAKEIKWGGAKDEPADKENEFGKMHPRASFKAFLEVVKNRSLPWEDVEMDAIHSLQLIFRGLLQNEIVAVESKSIVQAETYAKRKIQGLEELRTVTTEMVRLIETATVPILAVDSLGTLNGWNTKAAELTGLSAEEAIGMPFINLVEDETSDAAKNVFSLALQGKEEKNVEIKLKTFGPKQKNGPVILVVNACCSHDLNDIVVGVCFIGQDMTQHKMVMDKYTRIQGDYTAIIRNPSALIPPIFMIDAYGCCSEWNASMQEISGLKREDAIGKMLIGEVFTLQSFGCRVKDHDTLTKLRIVLNRAIAGHDMEKFLFGLYNTNDKYVEALLSANKKTDAEEKVTGVLCFLHVASPELQHALQAQRMSEHAAMNSLKELAHLRQEIRNPLRGIVFTRNLMEASELTEQQQKLIRTSALCHEQLEKILDDTNLENIEQCYLELNMVEFNLGDALEAVIVQGMDLSRERQISLVHDSPAEISSMYLYGDNLRLQQVLADILVNAIQFSPQAGGSVVLCAIPRKQNLATGVQIVHLDVRIIHPAPGIPETLVQEMFHQNPGISREGLGLFLSQKLVKIMNGTVQYLREAERSSFIVLVEFPLVANTKKR
ncbi:phytochrome C isoform X2 [Phalaenopsis equestris]|uniref:phytochrome C isoform X2 n=1 Tax=Phalaenopsis equestris TaxID=78828 RepID=UPI0009E30006|nr:phytochrome C isoform X2 [Phalaenopsis equestris]